MLQLLLLATLNTATAQSNNQPEETYQRRTVIDFGEIDVNGQLVKPDITPITVAQRPAFNPLIQLRSDFNKEMNASVNDIR